MWESPAKICTGQRDCETEDRIPDERRGDQRRLQAFSGVWNSRIDHEARKDVVELQYRLLPGETVDEDEG